MPRRVAELASRVDELQTEVDRLLDEYVETRRRLRTVERKVGTGKASAADDLDLDLGVESGATDGPDAPADQNQESTPDEAATEGEMSEQASPDDVEEAVQSVDGDPEDENEEESSGLDDIIIA